MSALILAIAAWSYVTAAYVIVFGTLIAYASWVIVRGRRIGRQLPPEERRWSQ